MAPGENEFDTAFYNILKVPYNLLGAPRQRNMAQMKKQSKTSERELSNEEITNPSDGELKTLVIKMLTDLIELGQK